MHKSVIFDIDGTLLDGTEGIINSVKYTVSQMKLRELSQEELMLFLGPPIQNSVKQKYNLCNEDAQIFANIFRKQYANGDVFLAKVYNGIYELLDYLKEHKFKLGVATYKREDYAIELMKHFKLDRYFDSICGADNENKLTKFDILVKCKNNIAAHEDEVIMIGDSFHDAEAAQLLNINFIGVTYGFGFKTIQDVNKYQNICCVKNPQELLEYFKKYDIENYFC